MKHFLTFLLLTASAALSATIHGDWQLYPTYDSNTYKIVDTPTRTYFLGLAQPYNAAVTEYSYKTGFVFYFDKESEETVGLTKRTMLSDNMVSTAEYNPDKRYLLVVYDNSNIDLIYDDGDVRNIPALMATSLPSSKAVNHITFYPEANEAYLATDFGYVVINDEKWEVADSRIYNTPLESVARMGDTIFLSRQGGVYSSLRNAGNYSLDDFSLVEQHQPQVLLLPLSSTLCAAFATQGTNKYSVRLYSPNSSGLIDVKELGDVNRTYMAHNRDGYMLSGGDHMKLLTKEGKLKLTCMRLKEDYNKTTSSWDNSEFWFVNEREGFYSRKYSDGQWTTTRGNIIPNAPSAFICQTMDWHPDYGILVSNHGISRDFRNLNMKVPLLLSGLDGGEWTKYGPAYTNPEYADVLWNPNGMAIDPADSKYVYFGSPFSGLLRLNLEDPTDLLHMSHPSDPTSSLPGYVEVAPDASNKTFCRFGEPGFDADGRLWVCFFNYNDRSRLSLWNWSKEDRLATTSAANFREFGKLDVEGVETTLTDMMIPLKAPSNRGLIMYAGNEYDGPIHVIDHNGTPNVTADDRVAVMNTIYDQDGERVDKHYVKCMVEDPSTGLVWVGTQSGVFTMNPKKVFDAPSSVTRIKVSRNDGTDLADYLLDGVEISRIAVDGQGRKWFATIGAGLVCTSSDGRTILGEFTTDNSWLPDNTVYGVAYCAGDGSMMVSTLKGLARFFPSGSSSGKVMDEVKAYPNPVRPDYYGYVTIDGLCDNALVKIVDSAGNLVKELGHAEGGRAQWDVTNHSHERVKTGVYFVMASSGPGDSNIANVTKVLVMN